MSTTFPLNFIIIGRKQKFKSLKKADDESNDSYTYTDDNDIDRTGNGEPDIKWGTIVFIEETQELYLNRKYYGGVNDQNDFGDGLTIGTNNTIGSYVTIGTNSFIGDEVHVGTGDSIGNRVTIGNQVTIGDKATIGANVKIGDGLSFTETNNVLTIKNASGKTATINLE